MTAASIAFLADAWVSLCAALGALVVLASMGSLSQPAWVATRFRFVLWLVMIFMAVRIGHWGDWGWLFSAVTNGTAALLPLSALLLAEGLLRRHAPPALKRLCAWGAAVFVLWGLLQVSVLEFYRIGGMLAFQLGALAFVAAFVARRDRASLAAEENRSVDRAAMSFVLILPFLVTDYLRDTPLDVPVRLGGLAVLALCWIAIGANRVGLNQGGIARSFGVAVAACALLSAVILWPTEADPRRAVQVFAILLAGVMLLAVWQSSVALAREHPQETALRHIAQAKGQGPEAALALIQQAAGAPRALLVTEDALDDVDRPALRALLDRDPVAQNHPQADEQIIWLLERFEASHVLALSTRPLRLAVLSSPSITASDPNGSGLRAIQRMAAMLAKGPRP